MEWKKWVYSILAGEGENVKWVYDLDFIRLFQKWKINQISTLGIFIDEILYNPAENCQMKA